MHLNVKKRLRLFPFVIYSVYEIKIPQDLEQKKQ